MLKVGVIGVGVMGKHHVRVYNDFADVKLISVADVDRGAVEEVAEQYGTASFTDFRKMLGSGVDAVSVCVPTSLHKEVAIACLDAGVHLLIEKPIASTISEAQEIISAAKKEKLLLQIGHIERFNPVVRVIKKAMEGEEVISIDIIRVGPHPPRVKDVGVVVDVGTHDIDLISYLTGCGFAEINAVVASAKNKFEDAAVLSFKLKSGAIAGVITNRLTPFKIRELKVATKSKLIYGNLLTQQAIEYSQYTADHESYKVKSLYVPFAEPLKLELRSFIDAVKYNKVPEVTGEDGLKALEVALRCLKKNR